LHGFPIVWLYTPDGHCPRARFEQRDLNVL
jgi:hypothetical protein